MAKKKKNSTAQILRMYQEQPTNWATIKRYYLEWRLSEEMALECDIPGCAVPQGKPMWNGKPLVLTMDHRDGCKRNNTTGNLQLACPNCDSQLVTKGGKNKDKVKNLGPYEYLVKSPTGKVHVVFGSGGVKGGGTAKVKLIKGKKKKKK